eukprot:7671856-Pyramimonas_sp.AAC.1
MLADSLGACLDDVRVPTLPETASYTVLLLAQRALGAAVVACSLGPGPRPDAPTKIRWPCTFHGEQASWTQGAAGGPKAPRQCDCQKNQG